MMRGRGGWTVFELVTVIGLLAFLLTFGSLAQSQLLPHYSLSAATRQVVTDLRLLRTKAISQNETFKMVFATDANAYHAERRNPSSGLWEPYALYSRGATTEATVKSVSLPSGVTTTSAIEVTFEPRGTVVVTTGTAPIVLSAPGPRTTSISINLAGLITIS
jgi:Tfp pilus assembly protein FimT